MLFSFQTLFLSVFCLLGVSLVSAQTNVWITPTVGTYCGLSSTPSAVTLTSYPYLSPTAVKTCSSFATTIQTTTAGTCSALATLPAFPNNDSATNNVISLSYRYLPATKTLNIYQFSGLSTKVDCDSSAPILTIAGNLGTTQTCSNNNFFATYYLLFTNNNAKPNIVNAPLPGLFSTSSTSAPFSSRPSSSVTFTSCAPVNWNPLRDSASLLGCPTPVDANTTANLIDPNNAVMQVTLQVQDLCNNCDADNFRTCVNLVSNCASLPSTNGNKTACDCYTNGAPICNNYYTNTGCANDAYAQGVIADLASRQTTACNNYNNEVAAANQASTASGSSSKAGTVMAALIGSFAGLVVVMLLLRYCAKRNSANNTVTGNPLDNMKKFAKDPLGEVKKMKEDFGRDVL